jgi:hypothetical protein
LAGSATTARLAASKPETTAGWRGGCVGRLGLNQVFEVEMAGLIISFRGEAETGRAQPPQQEPGSSCEHHAGYHGRYFGGMMEW